MFKKLKDKIAEEVKQSPLRLPTSVQQHLSQYSPFTREAQNGDVTEAQQIQSGLGGNAEIKRPPEVEETLDDIAEDSGEIAVNAFSIADVDSLPTSPSGKNKEGQFQPVNLNEPKREMTTSTPTQPANHTGGRLSRQSSLSSVFSDVSFLPGSSDSTYHPYQFQSDLESNVSEFDDSASQSGVHAVDRISKEHVYNAYQKMRVRYHKYKGRYSDLAKHYKELERDREKVKHVLTDTQDRSLRRISELKEQCILEQQAKAHLEEILRSDLEEKDNLIAVLQTKVKFLASPSPSVSEGPLVDLNNSETASSKSFDESDKDVKGEASDNEVQLLKEKLQRFESLLMKCKENIKLHIERNGELQTENETLKRKENHKMEEIASVQKMHRDELAQLTESLNMARTEIETLRHQEQEAALESAETKQKVHAELLKQEEEMVRLRNEREQLNNKVTMLETEIDTIKEQTSKQLEDAETALELEKQKLLKELSRGKTEALKLMDEDMRHRLEDLRKERDIHWETVVQKKLSEEAENHARTLRQTEEHYRSRLVEMQEEKTLALEEKELHCTSLVSREQNNQHGLQEEISNLKREIENKEKLAEKARDEVLEERRSWVQQIEDNRQRHLEDMQSASLQNQKLVEELEELHQNAIDTAVLALKQQHTIELEKIQLQHEELLQAANEDMESSAKNQIEQLRNLLRDKDSEMAQHNATLQELQDLLKSKELNICDLSSQINILHEKVTSMDAVSERLNSALEQTKLLEPLNLELEKAKQEVYSLNSKVCQLQEEMDVFKKSTESDKIQAFQLQQQLEESENMCEKLNHQVQDLNATINHNTERLLLLEAMKLEIAEFKETLKQKDNCIMELQADVEKAIDAKKCEFQQITEEFNKQSQTVQAELAIVKSAINAKDEQIAQLEQAQSKLIASESQLKSIVEEKDLVLCSKEAESVALKLSLTDQGNNFSKILEERSEFERAKEEIALKLLATQADFSAIHQVKDQRIAELQEEIEQAKTKDAEWELNSQELSKKLEATDSEVEELRISLSERNERVLQLEQAQSQWVSEESLLKLVVDENEKRFTAQKTELETLRNTLDSKEIRIGELQEELQRISLNLNVQDSELKQTNQDLSASLKSAQSELDELKANILQTNVLSTESEKKIIDMSYQLAIAQNELKTTHSNLQTKEEQVRQLNEEMKQKLALVEESQQQLADSELQLNAVRQSLNGSKAKISEFKETVSSLENTAAESTHQIKLLNHSLAVKESVIIDLQSEVARNGQLMLEIQTLSEEQRQQLLVEKDMQTEQYTNQLSSKESEYQRTVADLKTKLSITEKTVEESSVQLAVREDSIRGMELECATDRSVELEMKIQIFIDQLAQNESEKEILRTENDQLKEKLESKKIDIGSVELMEKQIKSLNDELSTSIEEKNRLENLCKRFKVQLADTRKLLSATKSAEGSTTKEIEITSPPKEVPGEAKINNLMQAELNQNELEGQNVKELLQQQIANLQRELDVVRHQHQIEAEELRRVIELEKASGSTSNASNGVENNFHGSLEEATELEYLRNIMFEYMMGRQPATLSKVVAAIVKFTPEQTRKIAEKEDQRQSLLGHLGLV